MKLLVFAHPAEAGAFLHHHPELRPCPERAQGYYQSPQLALLIAGEGMDRMLLSLGKVLAQTSGIKELYNFGIAAALESSLPLHHIVSVRTAYRYLAKGMEFKSYSTLDPEARQDCVSAFQRIHSDSQAKYLSHFGQLLDRELWAIGALCNFYRLPFHSYKLISDYALNSTTCQDIRAQSKDYSALLYARFEQILEQPPTASPKSLKLSKASNPIPPELYLTQSLQRQLHSLSRKWQDKYPHRPPAELYTQLYTQEIKSIPGHPKHRTLALLQKLRSQLFPLDTQVKREINHIIAPHTSEQVKIHYDPSLESSQLKIQLKVLSPQDLPALSQQVAKIPVAKIQQKIAGPDVS